VRIQTHLPYVALSRAQTHERNNKTGYENIVLAHPLLPEYFEIPEVRRQLIMTEYDRLRQLEKSYELNTDPDLSSDGPSLVTDISVYTIPLHQEQTEKESIPQHNTRSRRRKRTIDHIAAPVIGGEIRPRPRIRANIITQPLFTFSAGEESTIRRSLREGADGEIVIQRYGICIYRRKLRCLDGCNWINDDIINYMFAIWNERATFHQARHVFICTDLMQHLQKPHYNFDTDVRRWFNHGEHIKDDSILYIPVNITNTHWTLLVINMTEKSIKYYDGLRGKTTLLLYNIKCCTNPIALYHVRPS
jgi:Ulp1 protease family, C-terminal catalytic domain